MRTNGFSLKDQPNQHIDILREDKVVGRYMYAYDSSTEDLIFMFSMQRGQHQSPKALTVISLIIGEFLLVGTKSNCRKSLMIDGT